MSNRFASLTASLGLAAGILAGAASPATADDCYGYSGGVSIGFTSGWDNGFVSVGYSSPVYAYGPRHGYRGGSYYYNDCYYPPRSYRYYYQPRYYHAPRRNYYYTPRRYYRYDNCSPYYWSGGHAVEGYYVSSNDNSGTVNYRNDYYAGDPAVAPANYQAPAYTVARSDRQRGLEGDFDPTWAGDSIAMLRKGQVDDAILALEAAAHAVKADEGSTGAVVQTTPVAEPVAEAVAESALDAASGLNPEATRMLGLAMIADAQVADGAARILEAYRADPSLANQPIDERLFPSGARFSIRDLVRRASIHANQADTAEAWFALAVLMQAEGRDSVALDMVIKASGVGLDQSVATPMADSLRRVVYGRR